MVNGKNILTSTSEQIPPLIRGVRGVALAENVKVILKSTINETGSELEAKMAVITEEGKVNNGHIVLSKPLSLPEGTEVRVQIEPIETDNAQSTAAEENEDFASQPFFGMWADREDMRDSVAWVRKQRGKWKERITRTE